MKNFLSFFFNYLHISLSLDDVRDKGLFLREDNIVWAMDLFIVILTYVILIVFVRAFSLLIEMMTNSDISLYLYISLGVFSFFIENGFVSDHKLIFSRQMSFVLRSCSKLLALLVMDGVLVDVLS